MTKADHERWERYYYEALDRDELRRAYKQADEEDAKKLGEGSE